jgi:hypothetical protein
MIRIAVVDDHPIALSGFEYMLADVPDITVAAAVASAARLRTRLSGCTSTHGPIACAAAFAAPNSSRCSRARRTAFSRTPGG